MYQFLFVSGLILLGILGWACEFEPDGVNIQNMVAPTPPQNVDVYFEELSNSDTIYVRFDDLNVQVGASCEGHAIKELSYVLNGQSSPVGVWMHGDKNVYIHLDDLNVGVNELSFTLVLDTESNSIIDALGLESFVYQKRIWVCRLPYIVDDFMTVTSKAENGYLKVCWQKYGYPDFQKYHLSVNSTSYPLSLLNSVSIKNVGDTTYVDTSFIESNSTSHSFKISAFSTFGSRRVVNVEYLPSHPIPELKCEYIGEKVLFTWPKTKFYNSSIKYVLREYYDKDFIRELNVNDTSFILSEVPFGKSFDVELLFLKKDEPNNIDKKGSIVNVPSFGESTPGWVGGTFLYDSNGNSIYAYNGRIWKYSEEKNLIIQERFYDYPFYMDFGTSENRSKIIGFNKSDVMLIDPETLEFSYIDKDDINIIKKAAGLVPEAFVVRYALIDDAGMIYFSFTSIDFQYPAVFLRYDPVSKQTQKINVSNTSDLNFWTQGATVSNDGKFAVLGGSLYELQDGYASRIKVLDKAYFLPNSDLIFCKEYDRARAEVTVRYFNTTTSAYETLPNFKTGTVSSVSYSGRYIVASRGTGLFGWQVYDLIEGSVVRNDVYNICFVLSGKYVYGINNRRLLLK